MENVTILSHMNMTNETVFRTCIIYTFRRGNIGCTFAQHLQLSKMTVAVAMMLV